MDVGFIGLGAMGSGMAANIARAGHTVRAWARSPGAPIEGVTMVDTPREAFDADAVMTMLPDDAAIGEVILDAGLLERARAGLVHVVSATISVAFAEALAARHAQAGVGYVAAPVLGRPDVAAKGELNVLAAGDPAAIETVRPVLEAIGRKVWVMGEAPQLANAAKVAANMMITMAIEALAEAVVITERHGVSRDAFFDLALGTLFGGRAYETYSGNIRRGDYTPGFKAKLGLKDLRLAMAAGGAPERRLPMLEAVHARMQEAVASGLADQDWSVMADYTIRTP
jgi:3-hydroxyisobutyrate dehydrogenase-like beta-hydroxyacid dehydrogenase